MAKVTASQRKKTKQRTGSTKYPMETAAQIRSAVKLRHRSKRTDAGPRVSSSAVLARASRAVTRLLRAGKISARTAKNLRQIIASARAADKKR